MQHLYIDMFWGAECITFFKSGQVSFLPFCIKTPPEMTLGNDFKNVIHSFGHFYSAPFKSSTTQRCSRLQHGYCIGVLRRSAQATVGKGLAQGPYMAARAGVEPTPLRLKAFASA